MRVTRKQVAPGIDERDHRLTGEIIAGIAHLQRARAMALRAQVAATEPAGAAQVFGLESCHETDPLS
jgi:hypothetical protein